MPDFRSYCPTLADEKDSCILDPEESHHLVTTNRARVGAPVIAFDGKGNEAQCTLLTADKRNAALRIDHQCQMTRKHPEVTLFQAIPKGKSIENIIRQATELGVAQIQPMITRYTQVSYDHKNPAKKQAKWLLQALEGCKQSGNSWLPEVKEPLPFEDALADLSQYTRKLVGALPLKPNPWNELKLHADDRIAVAIGPEGDFSDEEYARLESLGFEAVSLGPHVQRCETAAISMLALVMAQCSS